VLLFFFTGSLFNFYLFHGAGQNVFGVFTTATEQSLAARFGRQIGFCGAWRTLAVSEFVFWDLCLGNQHHTTARLDTDLSHTLPLLFSLYTKSFDDML
jgi:hypothetical protein